ncbi:hypothetical protein MMC30_000154 [Trapelia coarctata]|nr:hypothetical protein [Trapelia coarctata]
MSGNRKYAGLPDLDIAPDIYETPELTDDASTRPTSTALRSESRASSYKDFDENLPAGIDRHGLDPDEARSHFLPARVDARDVDFSDRIDGRRKSYHTSSRRRRKDGDGDDDPDSESDEIETVLESLQRKIARLKREAQELKAEVGRQHISVGTGRDDAEVDEESLDQLISAIKTLDTLSTEGSSTAERRLAQKLTTSLKAPPSTSSTTPSNLQTPQANSSYTVTYAPSYASAHTLSRVAAFDTRLTLLETLLGLSSLPLPTQSRTPGKAILPILDTLDRQITFISTTSASTLDSISKKVRHLTTEAEKLDSARKAAKASQEALKAAAQTQAEPGSFPETAAKAEAASKDGMEDPEHVSKINALYGTLPTIESLAPLLPAVLDRLRSLRLIHADAASASQSLAAVEKRQAEMAEELRSWREGLEKVEGVMRQGEERMKGNMGAVEGWVRELEGRVKKLGV